MIDPADVEQGPDIVLSILELVRAVSPSVTAEQALEIEHQVRARYAGQRFRVAKRKKHLSQEQREVVFEVAKSDTRSTDELSKAYGIHRSTMYRLLKRGGK